MLYDILQNARDLLSLVLAYGFSVTVAGAFKAWVTKKAGDYTADHEGFLSLDPLVHVDLLGVVTLLLTGFGWGRKVPVNIHNIESPYRDLKILSVYYAQTVMHLLLTVLSILAWAGQKLLEMYIGDTVIAGVITLIISAFLGINIFLAVLRFIQSSVDLICLHLVERDPGLELYIDLGSLLVSLILLYTVGNHITLFFYKVSMMIATLLIRLVAY